MTPKETQDVEFFRVAYFDGRRCGFMSLSSEKNPHTQGDELHAAWELGRFSGLSRRAADRMKIINRRDGERRAA